VHECFKESKECLKGRVGVGGYTEDFQKSYPVKLSWNKTTFPFHFISNVCAKNELLVVYSIKEYCFIRVKPHPKKILIVQDTLLHGKHTIPK
jgi:hypothetical protein